MDDGPEGFRRWRSRVLSFITGIYRTRRVPADIQGRVSDAIIRKMIRLDDPDADMGEFMSALEFFSMYGMDSDLERLKPALKHPNPRLAHEAKLTLHMMAFNRGLPNPTDLRDSPQPEPIRESDKSAVPYPPIPEQSVPAPSRTILEKPVAVPPQSLSVERKNEPIAARSGAPDRRSVKDHQIIYAAAIVVGAACLLAILYYRHNSKRRH
jgi:hypothetical protein